MLTKFIKNKIDSFYGDSHLIDGNRDLEFLPKLSNELPYRYYDTVDNIYYNDDSIGLLYEVSPIIGRYSNHDQIMTQIMNSLTDKTGFQILSWSSPNVSQILSSWQERNKGMPYIDLARQQVEYFKDANFKPLFEDLPLIIRNQRIFFAIWIDLQKKQVSRSDINDLLKMQKQIKKNFSDLGTEAYLLDPNGLISFLSEIFNLGQSETTTSWRERDFINHQICTESQEFTIKESGVDVGKDNAIIAYKIKKYPEKPLSYDMSRLLGDVDNPNLQISCPFLQVLTAKRKNKSSELSSIQGKFISNIEDSSKKKSLFGSSPAQKHRDYKYIEEDLKAGGEMYEFYSSVILIGKKQEVLDSKGALTTLYEQEGFKLSQADRLHLPVFLFALPFGAGSSRRWTDIKTMGWLQKHSGSSLSLVSPVFGDSKGLIEHNASKPQVELLLFSTRGQIMLWNPYANSENHNIIVCGVPGSGKSVFLQYLGRSILAAEGSLVVIDKGKSFANSTEVFGGQNIDVNINFGISPFSFVDMDIILKPTEQLSEHERGYKNSFTNFLECFVAQTISPVDPMPQYDKSLIERTIREVLEEAGKNSSLDLIQKKLLSFSTVESDLPYRMAHILGSFLQKYGASFRGDRKIDKDEKQLVFETAELGGIGREDLKSAMLMLVMYMIEEKIYKGSRDKPTGLIIDEAWFVLEGGNMTSFLDGFVRTIRKYNGILVLATQGIPDFFKNEASITMFNQSYWKIYLKQDPNLIRKSIDDKMISENLNRPLNSLQKRRGYSEGLICSGNGYSKVRIILDKFSIAAFTSVGDEVEKINDLRKQGKNIVEAIKEVSKGI